MVTPYIASPLVTKKKGSSVIPKPRVFISMVTSQVYIYGHLGGRCCKKYLAFKNDVLVGIQSYPHVYCMDIKMSTSNMLKTLNWSHT